MRQNQKKKVFTRVITLAMLACLCVSMLAVTAYADDTGESSVASMVESMTVMDGYFADDFDPDVFYYDVYLSKCPFDSFVSVEMTDPRFEYVVTGEDCLTYSSEGNPVTVTVFDPLGKYETVEYHLTVFIGDDNTQNVTWQGLTYLDVENGIFSPQFNRYRTMYYAILENDVDCFDAAGVNYRTVNPDAAVEIECQGTLNEDGTIPEGKRVQYAIRVTEAGGTAKTYYLNLYRKAAATAAIDDRVKLSNITINGGAVDLNGFSAHRASYEVTVPKTITELDIQAYPADRSQIAYVFGPTTMRSDGPVFVNILVTSTVDDAYSIYTIRLEYDSFMHTDQYTSFQMVTGILLSGAVCLCAGFVGGRHSRKKSRGGRYAAETSGSGQKL